MDKVVFFDRDGVINVEKHYLYKIEEFEFIDKEFSSFKYLKNLGYKFVIITNQSGIDRGKYTVDDFNLLTNWMLERFKEYAIEIKAVNYCPHHPDFSGNCECRKPKIGMIKQAEAVLDIDYENSWLIGDKDSDIKAAFNANIPNTIQVRSGHSFNEKTSKAKFIIDSIKDIPSIIKE